MGEVPAAPKLPLSSGIREYLQSGKHREQVMAWEMTGVGVRHRDVPGAVLASRILSPSGREEVWDWSRIMKITSKK